MKLQTFLNTSERGVAFAQELTVNGWMNPGDYALMLLCISGSARFISEGVDEIISKNTGIMVGSFKYRIIERSSDFCMVVCVQTYDSMNQMYDGKTLFQFKKMMYRPRFFPMEEKMAVGCRFLLERASRAANDKESLYGDEIASCYIKAVLYNAMDIWEQQHKNNSISEKRETAISDQFITLVHEHHCKTRKVKDYADMMHITPKYLAANVLNATKRHATEWIDDYTVREIKFRLRSTGDTVQQISTDLNFSTPSHLTKFFRDKVGTTPLAYRKNAQD